MNKEAYQRLFFSGINLRFKVIFYEIECGVKG